MASSPALEPLQGKLEAKYKIYKLRDALRELDGYDDIIIDTPPAFHFYTLSALIAAQKCLIPFDCDDFSRRALYGLLESVAEVREDHNPRLEVAGIVVNQFQPRARLPQRMVDELLEEGLPVLEPYHHVVGQGPREPRGRPAAALPRPEPQADRAVRGAPREYDGRRREAEARVKKRPRAVAGPWFGGSDEGRSSRFRD